MCRPLHISGPLTRSGCHSIASNGGDEAGVGKSWCGGDDGVGDEMINALRNKSMSAKRYAEQGR